MIPDHTTNRGKFKSNRCDRKQHRWFPQINLSEVLYKLARRTVEVWKIFRNWPQLFTQMTSVRNSLWSSIQTSDHVLIDIWANKPQYATQSQPLSVCHVSYQPIQIEYHRQPITTLQLQFVFVMFGNITDYVWLCYKWNILNWQHAFVTDTGTLEFTIKPD